MRDLKSRNGTLVNGQPIEETQVKAGDVLKIGPVEFVIQVDGVPASFEKYLPEKKTPAQAPATQPVADENFDAAMEELSDVKPGINQGTEMLGELPKDFDIDDDLNL